MGGVPGFSRLTVVNWARGWLGLAERRSFPFPPLPRTASTTSSRPG